MGRFATETEPIGRFVGPREYRLEESLVYHSELHDPEVYGRRVGSIVVPAGTVTDFASIPRAFWRVLPPWDAHRRAAIIHDHLYTTQIWPKDVADAVFLEAMTALGVPLWKRQAMYRAVQLFGFVAWNSHKKENDYDSGNL